MRRTRTESIIADGRGLKSPVPQLPTRRRFDHAGSSCGGCVQLVRPPVGSPPRRLVPLHVCFHAVRKSWLDAIPPAACRPVFLPWLLMATDESGHRTARRIFSSRTSRRRRCGFATDEIRLPDRRWVISSDTGMAAVLLAERQPESSGLVDPLTGSARILPVPVRWMKNAAGVLSDDGTMFLHGLGPVDSYNNARMYSALLCLGTTVWTLARRRYMHLPPRVKDMYSPCFSYHNGNIVGCYGRWWSILSVLKAQGTDIGKDLVTGTMHDEPGTMFQSSYVLESRGELLWAWVQIKTNSSYQKDISEEHPCGCLGSLAVAWSVTVYALEEKDADGRLRWVKREGESLVDRVLFLGRPHSFAVDAARVDFSTGGFAYFVDTRNLYAGAWSKWPLTRCCVYRYSFLDDKSELVQELPPRWNHKACMWITPQPAIATRHNLNF